VVESEGKAAAVEGEAVALQNTPAKSNPLVSVQIITACGLLFRRAAESPAGPLRRRCQAE
jgi:hypothetical protein